MNYILFDDQLRTDLYPLTLTRSVADVLCGIWTMKERWEFYLQAPTTVVTVQPLQLLYSETASNDDCTYINAAYFANTPLVAAILQLERDTVLVDEDNHIVAYHSATPFASVEDLWNQIATVTTQVTVQEWATRITQVWDIFSHNGEAIKNDFAAITVQKFSQKLPDYVTVVGDRDLVFIDRDAQVMPCIINTHQGPVYIGEHAEVMEGCLVKGPLALRSHAVLKMGTKVYGATTLGSGSKVGGEVNNLVMFPNSNKGHDGFIGNAVIGEWCNLGADTNCSNLKNNYDEVKVWSIAKEALQATGLQFCGLIMGDHSKCGINTMFNTGTVVGVSANIFGAGFPDKYVPSFIWGGIADTATYQFDKALETANRMMIRRQKQLSEAEIVVLKAIYNQEIK